MTHGSLRMTALMLTGATTLLLLALAAVVVRQALGLSPVALLQFTLASAAQIDPRLAACPLIVVGGD